MTMRTVGLDWYVQGVPLSIDTNVYARAFMEKWRASNLRCIARHVKLISESDMDRLLMASVPIKLSLLGKPPTRTASQFLPSP